jgi:hypothetical protein
MDKEKRWRIILKWILERCGVRADWLYLAKDRVKWRSLVNTVMKLCVP